MWDEMFNFEGNIDLLHSKQSSVKITPVYEGIFQF